MKKTDIALVSICLSAMGGQVSAQQKPNIIFIFADDLGYGDIGCYGSRVNRTPNLDRMASEGMRFTDFYSASSVSSPSRAGLMTGRYPARMGINGVFFPGSFTGIPQEEVTLGEALQQQGYRTAIVGKWHLGHHCQYLPLQNGFHEYFGLPYSNDMAPALFMQGNEPGNRVANQDSLTIRYTEEALQFIDRNKERPFFLYLAHNMPHVPLAASPRFKGKSANGLYGDVIEELDWSVGEILKKLQETGLDEHTILIFSSDNGPWLTQGPMGGVATPCFQGKGSPWDGGFRVPAIIRWKGNIPQGRVSEAPAGTIDWFPTLVQLAGGSVPTDRIIDGKTLVPVLTGKGKQENHDVAYIESGKLTAFRSGDWKLLLPEGIRKGNFWVEDVPAHDTLLINLRRDITEQTDYQQQDPRAMEEMKQKLAAFAETLTDCPPSLFLMEWNTESLTNRQRQEALKEAISKGVKPKSK